MATTKRKPTVRKHTVRKPAVRKALARKPKMAPKARSARKFAGAKAMRLAGVGSEAVARATGRAWEEWLKVLDKAGAKHMAHKDIAVMLSRKFNVPDWWSQMVTVGYEQARGLRVKHQKASGFAANASKTVAASVDRLYGAWIDPALRARWLEAPIEIRRSTDGKSIRITWATGGTNVDVGFIAKGPAKSVVQVEHGKLQDTAAVMKQKAFWGDALNRLKALFEPVT
jgi:uncharacterized protein YndB with AHSA1/START domain